MTTFITKHRKAAAAIVAISAALTMSGAAYFIPVAVDAAGLTESQIQSILNLLNVFGADPSVVGNVSASLRGQPTQSTDVTAVPVPTTPAPAIPPVSTFKTPVSIPPMPAQNIPSFRRDLSFGMKGDDVRELQEFLTDQGYYAGPISGNYGLLTVQAMKKFQSANGISPTGYFGPRTRAVASVMMQKLVSQICPREEGCEGNVLPVEKLDITADRDLNGIVGEYFAATFTVNGGSGRYAISNESKAPPGLNFTRFYCPPIRGLACDQIESPNTMTLYGTPAKGGVFDIVIFAKDTAPTSGSFGQPAYAKERFTIIINDGKVLVSQSPVISGVKGPTTLRVGEEGVWSIEAQDPSNGALVYRVVWGDEYKGEAAVPSAAPQRAIPFRQTATFAHTYYSAGVYNPTFYVVNDRGSEVKTSITVNVQGTVVSGKFYIADVMGHKSVNEGDLLKLTIKGVETDGTPGTPDEGFNVQVYIKNQTTGEQVWLKKYSDGNITANADFDGAYWVFAATERIKAGNYEADIALYCGRDESVCAKRYGQHAQINQKIGFSVNGQVGASVTVISPNGGEVWKVGSSQTIRWSGGSGATGIYLYNEVPNASCGFCNFINVIVSDVSVSQGQFVWNVPSSLAPGGNYYVRLSGGSTADNSDSPFSIVTQTSVTPTITVLSPNGGEVWKGGETQTIKWSSANVANSVSISAELYKGNTVVDRLFYASVNDGSEIWTVPTGLASGSDYKIHLYCTPISGVQTCNADYSDSPFSIVAATVSSAGKLSVALDSSSPPTRTVSAGSTDVVASVFRIAATGEAIQLRQLGLEYYGSNLADIVKYTIWDGATKLGESVFNANKTSVFIFSNVVIPKDSDKLLTVKVDLASSAQTGNAFAINYNGDAQGSTSVGVGLLGVGVSSSKFIFSLTNYDVSANKITVGTPTVAPSITVLFPNGGEQWRAGETRRISWSASGSSAVRIYISDLRIQSSGSTNYITPNNITVPATTGYYDWTIPPLAQILPVSTDGTNFRIRIEDASNGNYQDSSDSPFSIAAATSNIPNISYITPTSLTVGSTVYVYGSNLYGAPFSLDGNYGMLPNYQDPSGTYFSFVVPSNMSVGIHTLRVEQIATGVLGNSVTFTVVASQQAPSITVLSPNGGEKWMVGNTYDIMWKSSGVEKVHIDVGSGTQGQTIVSGVPAFSGRYSWNIGANFPYLSAGDAYKIRVFTDPLPPSGGWIEGTNYDQSDAFFSIGAQTVTPPLRLDPIGDKTGTVSQEMSFAVSASGADDGAVAFSASGLPSGAKLFSVGDVTMDGGLSSLDVTYILQYLEGSPPRVLFNTQKLLADVDRDGAVTKADSDLLLEVIVGNKKSKNASVFMWAPLAAGSYVVSFSASAGGAVVSEKVTVTVSLPVIESGVGGGAGGAFLSPGNQNLAVSLESTVRLLLEIQRKIDALRR